MPVNSTHPLFEKMLPRWSRCRDAYDGTDAVKAGKEKYLPRLTKQDDDDYKAYIARALFYGATERTIQGLAGAAISKPFQYKVPTTMEYLEEDSTDAHMCLDELVKWEVSELLGLGRIGLLVDMDAAGEDDPYIVPYRSEQIINWTVGEDGELTMVMLQEVFYEPKENDPYTMVEKERWRELVLEDKKYVQKLHTKSKVQAQAGVIQFDTVVSTPVKRGNPLDFIPFVIAGPNGISHAPAKPPLLALVDVNLSHYRNSADLEHGRHYTGLPTPWITGQKLADGAEMRIGSSAAWVLPNEGAKCGYLEFTGKGLASLSEAMDQKEKQMAVLGARLLESQKLAAEAADTLRMRASGDTYTLGSITSSAADALEMALGFIEKWMGGDGMQSEVEPNKDYVDEDIAAPEITALLSAYNSGAMTLDTFLWNLKRGDRLKGEVQEEVDALAKEKANAPNALPQLTPEERAAAGLPPAPAPKAPAAKPPAKAPVA